MFNLHQLLFVILLVNGLIVAVSTLKHRNLWPLTLFMLLMSAHMGVNLVSNVHSTSLQNVLKFFSLLYGPLIYLFILSVTTQGGVTKRTSLVTLTIGVAPILLVGVLPEPAMIFLALLLVGVFLFLGLRRVQRYHRVVAQTKSSDGMKLNWLVQLVVILGFVIANEFVRYGLIFQGFPKLANGAFVITICLLIAFIFAFTLHALRNAPLLTGINQNDETLAEPQTEAAEFTLDDPKQEDITKLLNAMTEEELYLQPNLTIAFLAERSALPARDASLLINGAFQMNFSEFVNRFRIQQACELLVEDANKSVLAIATQVGFNSKSTFNDAFKRYVEKTPTQYRQAPTPVTFLPKLNTL